MNGASMNPRAWVPVAALLLPLVPPAQASGALHPSLQDLEAWLGAWADTAFSGDRGVVEYRAVLGGRFVESWRRDARSGELSAHSMIAADSDGGGPTEYRFDRGG